MTGDELIRALRGSPAICRTVMRQLNAYMTFIRDQLLPALLLPGLVPQVHIMLFSILNISIIAGFLTSILLQLRERGPGLQIRFPPSGEHPAQQVRVHSPTAEDRPSTSYAPPRRTSDAGPSISHALPSRRVLNARPSYMHGVFTYLLDPTTRYWGTGGRLFRAVLTPNPEDCPSFVPLTTTHVSATHIFYFLLPVVL